MTTHDTVASPDHDVAPSPIDRLPAEFAHLLATAAWLETEFPGWTISVDRTGSWEGGLRPLWIARRDGHHPQAELSAAKLHTRLTDYLERTTRHDPSVN